jgi:hypothetical protein
VDLQSLIWKDDWKMKISRKYQIIGGVLISIILLLSYLYIDSIRVRNIDQDNCIPPIDSFVYSFDTTKEIPHNVAPKWEEVIDVPRSSNMVGARTDDNHTDLIFLTNTMEKNSYFFDEMLLFDSNTKKFKSTPAEIGKSGVYIEKIFVDKENEIWASSEISTLLNASPETKVSLLSRYNDLKNEFEFVPGIDIPYTVNEDKYDSTYWVKGITDGNGIMWFFVPRDGIYSFLPQDGVVKRTTDISQLVPTDLVVGPDNSIYFIDLKSVDVEETLPELRFWTDDYDFYKYDITQNTVKKISMYFEPWPYFHSILVDHNGNLWASGLAYREPSGKVYQLDKSPIFITGLHDSSYYYSRWESPEIQMESSDGRFWFQSENGIAWLDLSEQKWCWISTTKSNILEDDRNYLWLIADDKLYRKEIKPADWAK